jgi:hypothetical protein
MARGSWAYITFVQGRPGGNRPPRPTDPDYGVDEGVDPGYGVEGGWDEGHPDQGLPGFPGAPGHPGHLPARPGRPVDPGYGRPGGGRPPRPGNRPPGSGGGWGGHPDQGLPGEDGAEAGQLPVWPLGPDQGLPPIAGQPLPPTDPPPGTIWPPLPPGAEIPAGKALLLAAIKGVGYRYIVVEIEPAHPDQGLPGGEGPETQPPAQPDQGLPQPQPPTTPQPKSRLGR